MNTKNILQKIVTLLFVFFPLFSAMAQGDDFSDDVQDVPTAPIDNYLSLAVIVGLYIASRFFKQQQLSTNLK